MCETATTAKTETAGATQGGVAGTETEPDYPGAFKTLHDLIHKELSALSMADKDTTESAMSAFEGVMEEAIGSPAEAASTASLCLLTAPTDSTKLAVAKILLRDYTRFGWTQKEVVRIFDGVATMDDSFRVTPKIHPGDLQKAFDLLFSRK